MYSVITYYLITNAKQVPEQWQVPKSALQFYNFYMILCSIRHPFEQFRIAVLVLSLSTFLCTLSSSLAGQHNLKYPWLCAALLCNTETSVCYQHIFFS